ncbi:MAG TPA: biotin--[acetyl-CoA-carboxylase] ligase [Actinomycetes bacterium]|nr:biotin--[acetyl-CoA-carboxylase] ligase [Actinomycetes bacterium]
MTSPYRDLDRPPLREADLRRALLAPPGAVEPGLWRDIRVVDSTASTNADLLAAAQAGGPEGTVLVAEEQTAGRGRLDRGWVAPARSGLTFSALLRPNRVPPARRGWLPLLAGVAAAEALSALATEVLVRLKWPNDVLAGPAERKMGGILVELVGDAAVVGVGLNVTLRTDELPAPTATSLAIEGAQVDRDSLLRAVLRRLAGRYESWIEGAGDPEPSGLRTAYVELCGTLGRPVRVVRAAQPDLLGTATGIDAFGQLVVDTADHGPHTVGAGDVIHVR